ncbi:hypothetical protein AYI69_g5716 [Smittium culicis]|uniref:Uncharacterized protein n=1 Tax=Smittium culicis TaxID=133412 RepID=A0A1R1Y465_9FUNG|nr:hypothetical protein AYI69_g5716 [Smittium culicis]
MLVLRSNDSEKNTEIRVPGKHRKFVTEINIGNRAFWCQYAHQRDATSNSETQNKVIETGMNKADENRPDMIKKPFLIHREGPIDFRIIITVEAHDKNFTGAKGQNLESRKNWEQKLKFS